MIQRNEKITLLQAMLIFLVATHTASLRFITSASASAAHQAAWLSVPVSMIVFLPLLYMLYKVMHAFEGKSLHDILCAVLGKAIGKSLSLLIALWLLMLLSLYMRYASDTLVTTVFTGADYRLLLFILAGFVLVIVRWGIAVISRMNKLIFVLIVAQLALTLFFLFLHFRPDFVTPISTLDIVPVAQSAIYPLTIFVYITPLFVFNDNIVFGEKRRGKLALTAGFLTATNTLILLALIGMLGWHVISKLTVPYFTAVQNISVFDSSAGLDSLFMSIRTLADFITIAFFAYCSSRMIKNVFGLNGETPLLTPIIGFAFFFAVYFGNSTFELISFSRNIVPYLNLSLGLGVPLVLFAVAKIRKMV